MQWWRISAGAAGGLLILVLAAQTPAPAAGCDEDNPRSPARHARIALTAADAVDEARDQLRTFVATGSLGRVSAATLSSHPPGIVRQVAAAPHVSRYSPLYGEQLKGVDLVVSLYGSSRAARVVVDLQQVCAQYFRNSFLSY